MDTDTISFRKLNLGHIRAGEIKRARKIVHIRLGLVDLFDIHDLRTGYEPLKDNKIFNDICYKKAEELFRDDIADKFKMPLWLINPV